MADRDDEREQRVGAESRVSTVLREKDLLATHLASVTDDLTSLRALCEEQKTELESTRSECHEFRDRLEEERGRFRSYRLETKEFEQKYKDVESMQRQKDERHIFVKSQLAEVETENSQLTRDIAVLKQKLIAKEDTESELRTEMESQKRHLERERQRSAEQGHDVQQRLKRQLEEAREECRKAQQIGQQYLGEQQSLQDEIAALKEDMEQLQQVNAKYLGEQQSRQDEVAALKEDMEQLQQVNAKQRSQIAVLNGVEADYAKSTEELQLLKERSAEMEALKARFEVQKQLFEDLSHTSEQVSSKHTGLQQELETLKRRNEELTIQFDKRRDAEKDKEAIDQHLQEVQARLRESDAELQNLRRVSCDHRMALSRIGQLDSHNKKLSSQHDSTHKQLTEVMSQCRGLQKIVKHRDQQLIQLKEDMGSKSSEETERLRAQIETISQEKLEYDSKMHQLIDARTREKCDKLRHKYEVKINKLQTQLNDRDGFEQRMRELMEAELQGLQRWHNEMEQWDDAGQRQRKAEETGAWKKLMADQLKHLAARFERRLLRILEAKQPSALQDPSAYIPPYYNRPPV
eukprot:GHVQ01035456.1.p1 GENE.GHVQ01035456.1~~GHVQ01035456.1.p1  ORF type:complete len:604 (-),score=130.21 GHVQ01035456.1:759-2489(-)